MKELEDFQSSVGLWGGGADLKGLDLTALVKNTTSAVLPLFFALFLSLFLFLLVTGCLEVVTHLAGFL